MKNSRFFVFTFLGLFVAIGITFAADTPSYNRKDATPLLDTNGNPAPPGSVINTKTGRAYTPEELQRMSGEAKMDKLRLQREAEEAARQAAERFRQEEERRRQEEERRRQEEAARPRCSLYRYYGPNARPEPAGGDNLQCPPAYQCHWNGPFLECRAMRMDTPEGSIPGSGPVLSETSVVYQDDTRLCRMAFCGSVANPRGE